MCKDCQKRERKYEWIRNREGNPRKMKTGGYVMQDENGACFGFNVETIDRVKKLLDEIRELENGYENTKL